MRTFKGHPLKGIPFFSAFALGCSALALQPAAAQDEGIVDLLTGDTFSLSAASPLEEESEADTDILMEFATSLDGAAGGVSSDELLEALEDAAEAGQPIALWRLGVMYENGEGVAKDEVKAFQYYSRIVVDGRDTQPKSVEAEVVAQSLLKVGHYLQTGLPDAGVKADSRRSLELLMYAASYFGDPDAQYQVGRLFLDEDGGIYNPVQGARWLVLSARKGHAPAQAALGDLLFNGDGIEPQPVEGLMWLTIAERGAFGTSDEALIADMLDRAMSVATPDQRLAGIEAAESIGAKFGGY